MHGWITVVLIAGGQLLLAIFLMYRAAARWWHYFAILLLAIPLIRLSLFYTGDISRYTPPNSFAEGAEGKDQIIIASASSTILQAAIIAAATFGVLRWCWQRFRHG